ncbi:MAG: TonB-dependent receptor plug domain-containing protein, partial [Pseudomonadota bacterium]
MKLTLLVLVFSTAAVSPVLALENDPDRDVISVTGLRAQPAEDITASVSVLDEAQLQLRNAPFLADSLRSVPGLGVSRSGASGGLTQVRLRGAEANHTLVLIDGIEVSDPTTGETDFGLWSGLQATRIEVARGEQSALYGSDAIGGVIAVTTESQGFRVAAETGSRQTARGYLSAAQPFEGFSLGGVLSAFTTEGVDTSGGGGEEDGSNNYTGLLRGAIDLGEAWEARGLLRVARSTVETDADTDFDGRLNDSIRETETDQRLGGLIAEGPAFGIDHLFRASFAEVVRENTANGVFTDETTGERLKFSYSPSRQWKTGSLQHHLTGLIDHEQEDYKRVDTDTLFGDSNQSQDIETLGLAAEYQLSAGDLTVSASARHDNNDGLFDDATT